MSPRMAAWAAGGHWSQSSSGIGVWRFMKPAYDGGRIQARPARYHRARDGLLQQSHPVARETPPMRESLILPGRRLFLGAAGTALFTTRGLFAEELTRTPAQTEGPFYPNKLPLDTDNDLLIINDTITPAVGEVTHLTGRVLDASGNPIRNALVEIWQCDAKGVYLH